MRQRPALTEGLTDDDGDDDDDGGAGTDMRWMGLPPSETVWWRRDDMASESESEVERWEVEVREGEREGSLVSSRVGRAAGKVEADSASLPRWRGSQPARSILEPVVLPVSSVDSR